MNTSDKYSGIPNIIDIKTGRPCEVDVSSIGHIDGKLSDIFADQPRRQIYHATIPPLSQNSSSEQYMDQQTSESYDEKHAALCESTRIMLAEFERGFGALMAIASQDEKLLRSLHWYETVEWNDGTKIQAKVTIRSAIKSLRRDLEWLEAFFKRELRK